MDAELLRALQPGIVALGWTLIDFLWQGALIVALYAAVRGALRGARARLLAGHVALLALAIAPVATLLSHLDAPGATGSAQVVSAGVAAIVATTAPTMAQDVASEVPPNWLWWLVALWAGGVLLLSLRLWREWRRLQRLCLDAEPLDADWQRRFARLCTRLNVRLQVRLLQGVQVATPMLVGVLRPTILLPASLVARMPADQLELVLIHELAHLRRLDPLFNLLQTALDTLLFYHPGMHWVSRKVREDRELCCDELVVASGGDRFRYARALLALAEGHALQVATPALAATGGALMERVERIVEVPAAPRGHTRALVIMLLLGVLVMQWWLPARERADEANRLASLPLSLSAMPAPSTLAAPALEIAIGDIATRLGAPAWAPPAATPDEASSDVDVAAASFDAIAPVADVDTPAPEAIAPLQFSSAAATPPQAAATEIMQSNVAAPPVATLLPIERARDTADAPSAPAPVRRIAPAYPRAARLAGVEGFVVLDYRIEADGSVGAIAVVESQPEGVFDTVAQRTLERWRYAPDAAAQQLTQRFDFVLPDDEAGASRRDSDRCRQQTGSRVCRPTHAQLP